MRSLSCWKTPAAQAGVFAFHESTAAVLGFVVNGTTNMTHSALRARLAVGLRTLGRLPGLLGRGSIRIYRYTLSPLIGYECRHLPTCSHYAEEAIERFGLWAGGWMTLARMCRCHPWGTSGLDFVPGATPMRSHWFMPWRYGRWRGTNSEAN